MEELVEAVMVGDAVRALLGVCVCVNVCVLVEV